MAENEAENQAENQADTQQTLALKTKLEDEFVSPLTAVRGALEILRDFPDLAPAERQRFVTGALQECIRLEKGVEQLATSVYAAGQRARQQEQASHETTAATGATGTVETPDENEQAYNKRIRKLDEHETIEVDFSDFEFSSSQIVNAFYNILDNLVEHSGRRWYFLVNYRNCSIWPEAWVAFAHRGKKVNASYSLGTVHYIEQDTAQDAQNETGRQSSADRDNPNMFASRNAALAHIDELRQRQQPARRR